MSNLGALQLPEGLDVGPPTEKRRIDSEVGTGKAAQELLRTYITRLTRCSYLSHSSFVLELSFGSHVPMGMLSVHVAFYVSAVGS